ncbi:fungal hydrophobin [Suillus clintonianus]|uniref:fungal hydrophobin n=1 Tax=Suillus clintonianus TaxID=1904413 RepID=UPI001B881500|nr:fungal hydrophobin [Suillus clintonianus]KAG2140581.1 fungal hydrophobin [Suillus clintonianus]
MIFNIFALLPFALLAAAQASQCDTGAIQCCEKDSMYSQTQPNLTELGLVDVAVVVDAFVALTCSGINVVGTSTGCSANQEPVCCENEKYNGGVSIGCTPINISL